MNAKASLNPNNPLQNPNFFVSEPTPLIDLQASDKPATSFKTDGGRFNESTKRRRNSRAVRPEEKLIRGLEIYGDDDVMMSEPMRSRFLGVDQVLDALMGNAHMHVGSEEKKEVKQKDKEEVKQEDNEEVKQEGIVEEKD